MATTTITAVQEVLVCKNGHVDEKKLFLSSKIGTDHTFRRKIVWGNVIGFFILHCAALYGLYLSFAEVKWLTVLMAWTLGFLTEIGITAGAHRLYSHKSYKANLPLRFILIILQTMAGQNCMYIWVRDHRLHHKYSDTDADPHNANRGFFFCHMGWLMSKKHPKVMEKGKTLDMSDLKADPLVMFQMKHYYTLYILWAIVIPVAIPVLCWSETVWNSLFTCYFLRYVGLLHITWTVNSIAHFYGTKPFDKDIVPVQSRLVSIWAGGEGWHNYHHAFPWDYRASEFGTPHNPTSAIIDMLAYFGMAYDLKAASAEMIQKRVKRTGDGTHPFFRSTTQSVTN